jgi:uncharacterized protein
MIIVLSPAKSLDFTPLSKAKIALLKPTLPQFSSEAASLVEQLREFSVEDLQSLMSISPELGRVNQRRFAEWRVSFPPRQSKPAALAFDGDVYDGLNARAMGAAQLRWANQHVRILSGLYGLLKPLDWLQPYRLEMGTKLANSRGKTLYQFWGDRLALELQQLLTMQPIWLPRNTSRPCRQKH